MFQRSKSKIINCGKPYTKKAIIAPSRSLCTNCIGPYIIKGNISKNLNLICY